MQHKDPDNFNLLLRCTISSLYNRPLCLCIVLLTESASQPEILCICIVLRVQANQRLCLLSVCRHFQIRWIATIFASLESF